MTYFSRYGGVDRNNPQAAGMCDIGGEIRKHSDLRPQMQWAGGKLVWNGLMVCRHHMDVPNPQDRRHVLRADPVPVPNPRPDLDAEHIRRTIVDRTGAALTYPGGQWIEAALSEDVDRNLYQGGVNTTPPIIPPVLTLPEVDLHAPLDLFVLGYHVLDVGDGTTGVPTDTNRLLGADSAVLTAPPPDGSPLTPPV